MPSTAEPTQRAGKATSSLPITDVNKTPRLRAMADDYRRSLNYTALSNSEVGHWTLSRTPHQLHQTYSSYHQSRDNDILSRPLTWAWDNQFLKTLLNWNAKWWVVITSFNNTRAWIILRITESPYSEIWTTPELRFSLSRSLRLRHFKTFAFWKL